MCWSERRQTGSRPTARNHSVCKDPTILPQPRASVPISTPHASALPAVLTILDKSARHFTHLKVCSRVRLAPFASLNADVLAHVLGFIAHERWEYHMDDTPLGCV